MDVRSIVLVLFSFLVSGSTLYTEVRKLSGNEYRDIYKLPVYSNSSLPFHARRTLFKWDVGNYTVPRTKAVNISNNLKNDTQKRKNKKGKAKWLSTFNQETNTTNHERINKHSVKQSGKKKRLKKKREGKRNKRKKQKIKREKKNRNKNMIPEQNSLREKSNNNTFPAIIHTTLIDQSTLAEQPKKLISLASKYEPKLNVENIQNTFEAEHIYQTDKKQFTNHNEILEKHDSQIPNFRSKWKIYAQRNFTTDVNECLIDNGGCEGLCINTPGSYICHCPQGFRLDVTKKLCLDINECAARNGHGPCQGECTNIWGSYRCGCQTIKGTQLAEDGKSCTVIDACSTHNCSHVCISTRLGAFCSCPHGYILGDDWRTCQDIDECQLTDLQDHKCDGKLCENTPGSYKCI